MNPLIVTIVMAVVFMLLAGGIYLLLQSLILREKIKANVDKVYTVLHRQKVNCDREQAERVAWRIVKDWVEAQMAILESEMVQIDEIFLPYMVNNDGQTLFEAYRHNQLMIKER